MSEKENLYKIAERLHRDDSPVTTACHGAEFWRALLSGATRPCPSNARPEDEFCPVCGYYCLGKGGVGCIDKPSMCRQALEGGD